MGRAPCCDKIGLKKGRWTSEEDEILTKYIQENGEGSWRTLPKNAGLLRCGKSCRLRWINYLRSDLKRGNISSEEEEIIFKLHRSLGNRYARAATDVSRINKRLDRWSIIAGYLPGRTDNEIKNYWNSHLSRKFHSYRRENEGSLPLIIQATNLAANDNGKNKSNSNGMLKKQSDHGGRKKNKKNLAHNFCTKLVRERSTPNKSVTTELSSREIPTSENLLESSDDRETGCLGGERIGSDGLLHGLSDLERETEGVFSDLEIESGFFSNEEMRCDLLCLCEPTIANGQEREGCCVELELERESNPDQLDGVQNARQSFELAMPLDREIGFVGTDATLDHFISSSPTEWFCEEASEKFRLEEFLDFDWKSIEEKLGNDVGGDLLSWLRDSEEREEGLGVEDALFWGV